MVDHKIVVLSGKGGVGKSTVATNLAAGFALCGKRVGLLDVDIHGPSIPRLLHLRGPLLQGPDGGMLPVQMQLGEGSLRVMSIGFLLAKKEDAVVWRGPRKYGVIKQFIEEVEWGPLDVLVVDSPPGTGDEPLAVVELLGKTTDGAVIVTTPQELALQDVRRSISFCRQLELPIIGVVENMSGFVCPHCGERTAVFGDGGGRALAAEMSVPLLAELPIEPGVVRTCDDGVPVVQALPDSLAAKAFMGMVRDMLGGWGRVQ